MRNLWFSLLVSIALLSLNTVAFGWDKGIYLTQYMLEKPEKLDYFLEQAKATGINTFVVDHDYYSSKFAPAISKIKAANIKFVARIVVFSDGANAKQIRSQAAWEEKFKFVEEALKAGADAIQLDYIRYSSKMPANPEHAKDVYKIIKWFKSKINPYNVPMEIDIFGEVSYYPSMHIGQDIKMFADAVDGVNPMVYPSHFWPYEKYSAEPYKTINNSLNALVAQFNDNPPFRVHAFIEAVNYHFIKKSNNAEKQRYLLEEIRAVEDAKNAAGWYVWSANNVYDNLFEVLKNNKTRPADFRSYAERGIVAKPVPPEKSETVQNNQNTEDLQKKTNNPQVMQNNQPKPQKPENKNAANNVSTGQRADAANMSNDADDDDADDQDQKDNQKNITQRKAQNVGQVNRNYQYQNPYYYYFKNPFQSQQAPASQYSQKQQPRYRMNNSGDVFQRPF